MTPAGANESIAVESIETTGWRSISAMLRTRNFGFTMVWSRSPRHGAEADEKRGREREQGDDRHQSRLEMTGADARTFGAIARAAAIPAR